MKETSLTHSPSLLRIFAVFIVTGLTAKAPAQSLDSFEPRVGPSVYATAIQPDGKILVGGDLHTIGGQPRRLIGRLNTNGSLDATFNANAELGVVSCLAVLPDGKIIVGGYFTNLAGTACTNIGRLNSNGALDNTFHSAADGPVLCLAVQPDGRVLVGGLFTNLAGLPRSGLGRLNLDGTLDTSFAPPARQKVYCLAVQPDGKILAGGDFRYPIEFPPYPYRLSGGLDRFTRDGMVDTSFVTSVGAAVYCLTLQADGKILVGGSAQIDRIRRVNTDGTWDAGFNPTANGSVESLALQADGKVLVAGSFNRLCGEERHHLGRLNSDGSLDTSFRSFEFGELVPLGDQSLALQKDGKILVAGLYSATNGPDGMSRLNNVGSATQTLLFEAGTITWLRDGTCPEVWRTTFEVSYNQGVDWFVLGAGTRRTDGWELGGVSLAPHALIRARGYTSGGYHNGSTWFEEASLIANEPPVADARATHTPVISPNGVNARVLMDGTRSADPDGDDLHYRWYVAANPDLVADGAVAEVVLPLGSHESTLVVSDGALAATNTLSIEVITPAEAIDRLVVQVESSWPKARPLVASLDAALASLQRGNTTPAINQLQAFQNKVRAQVQRQSPALAESFLFAAQEIISALPRAPRP